MAGSIYIHTPFCRAKCAYCDFYSLPADEALAARYVVALRREAQRRARGEAETVYMGGGTPSVLPPGAIRDIMGCLSEHVRIVPGAEITLEANPESITPELIKELESAGVTRMSIGVQSFQDLELQALGRVHTASQARDALSLASASGVMDISLDLMYSLPGQDAGSWRRTLQEAINLAPSHISAYELTPEPATPLMQRIERGEVELPTGDEAIEMYYEADSMLTAAGYEHYEVSNYALPARRSRHNMNYWRRGMYIGLGPGAVSFDGKVRTMNLPDVEAYCRAMQAGGLPPSESETLTAHEAAREFLMLGLRTCDGIGLEEARSVYGLGALSGCADSFIAEGLMQRSGDRLRLSPDGTAVMNSVLVGLFDSLGI